MFEWCGKCLENVMILVLPFQDTYRLPYLKAEKKNPSVLNNIILNLNAYIKEPLAVSSWMFSPHCIPSQLKNFIVHLTIFH